MNNETIFSMNVSVRTSSGGEEIERRDLQAEDLGNYIVLREMLDLFQRRMVEYFFAGENAAERAERAEDIRLRLREIPNAVWAVVGARCQDDTQCGPGERCVNGICQSSGTDEPAPEEVVSAAQTIAG